MFSRNFRSDLNNTTGLFHAISRIFVYFLRKYYFFRDNLDWLARATNWDKLSATASLGVIHRGHEKDSLALMQTYLPRDSANSSGFAEGGGLYALGLIHANHGGEITEYLLGQLKQVKLFNIFISIYIYLTCDF